MKKYIQLDTTNSTVHVILADVRTSEITISSNRPALRVTYLDGKVTYVNNITSHTKEKLAEDVDKILNNSGVSLEKKLEKDEPIPIPAGPMVPAT